MDNIYYLNYIYSIYKTFIYHIKLIYNLDNILYKFYILSLNNKFDFR